MDKKISELDPTLNLSDQADFPLSQDNGGEPTTFRAKLTQIATKIAEAITFSNLKTGDKQLVSAVNQTISNLADDFNTTAGSTYAKDDCVLYNGVLYQCINNSGTTSGKFIAADWTEIKAVDVGSGGGGGGGGSGHTIVDDDGTSLPQRSKLQFIGAYSEDNQTDDTTEVNVVRSMTKAEFNQLSADEKVGLIEITDEDSVTATEIPIQSGSATNTKDYIDSGLSGKVDTGACIPFVLDYPSSITGLVKYATSCYYNPQTNEVHINIVIYSNQNNIPNNGGVIATIPSEYRPSAERVVASFADIMDGTNALHFEAIQPIGTNGEIKLHNFVYAGNINTISMNFVYYK